VYGSGQDLPIGDLRIVSPGFFPALGVRLIRGRMFSETDDESRPPVTIVDEEFARRMFKRDPIGQRIALDPQPGQKDSSWVTIVGVVAHTAHEALDAPRRIQYYFPYAQRPGRNVAVVMRARVEPASLAREVRAAIKELDSDLPISSLGSMSSWIEASMWQRRLAVLLLALFSGVATTLASLGIYGHMSFMVARRSRDVGIRRALGAPTVELTLGVVRDGLALTTVGAAAGVVLGASLARLLASQLYEVAWLDPAVLIAASLLILVVALAAIVVPASRAMTADPLVVLQSE
jgi:putative ABC transport system permease protein